MEVTVHKLDLFLGEALLPDICLHSVFLNSITNIAFEETLIEISWNSLFILLKISKELSMLSYFQVEIKNISEHNFALELRWVPT